MSTSQLRTNKRKINEENITENCSIGVLQNMDHSVLELEILKVNIAILDNMIYQDLYKVEILKSCYWTSNNIAEKKMCQLNYDKLKESIDKKVGEINKAKKHLLERERNSGLVQRSSVSKIFNK